MLSDESQAYRWAEPERSMTTNTLSWWPAMIDAEKFLKS